MAYNPEIGPWGGMANPGAKAQTYEEFLAELAQRPGLLGADGTLQGSAIGGGPWDSWGKTPEEFYKEKMATKVQSGFTGFGDNMENNMVDPTHVSLDRTEDTRGQGLRTGLMMLAAPFAAQAMGLGGGVAGSADKAALFGAGGYGEAATAAELSGMGGSAAAVGGPGSAGWGMDLGMGASGVGGASGAGSAASSLLPFELSPMAAPGAVAPLTAAELTGIGGAAVPGIGAASAAAKAAGGGWMDSVGSFLKDNPTLTQLGGMALGALSAKDQNQTSTQNRDPWAPAQQYLKDNLATNAAMQKHYQANPFSAEQKNAYQGLLNTIANNQANGNVLLGNASKFGQSQKGAMPQMAGLLTGTQAPIVDWAKYANIGLLGG